MPTAPLNADPGSPAAPTLMDRSHLTAVPILANPYSGAGQNVRLVAQLAEALRERGLDPEPVWDMLDRAELLSEPTLAERARSVVVAGGDGSVADVVNDLAAANPQPDGRISLPDVPLAMLPMGNENLLARQFGYGDSAQRIAQAIDQGRTRCIDIAQAGEKLFTLMVSSGFDADVVDHVDRWRRQGAELRRIRRRNYAPVIGRRLLGYRFPRAGVEVDGEVHRGSHVFVFNLPQYGGRLPIGSRAEDDDGLLDWIVFKKPGLLRLAGYGLSVIAGRHLSRADVVHGRAARLRLLGPCEEQGDEAGLGQGDKQDGERGGCPVQADGDAHGQTPLAVRVHPRALRVVTTTDAEQS